MKNILSIDLPRTINLGIAIFINDILIETIHVELKDIKLMIEYIDILVNKYNINNIIYECPMGSIQNRNAGIIIGYCFAKEINCKSIHPRSVNKIMKIKGKGIQRKKDIQVIVNNYTISQHEQDAVINAMAAIKGELI